MGNQATRVLDIIKSTPGISVWTMSAQLNYPTASVRRVTQQLRAAGLVVAKPYHVSTAIDKLGFYPAE